jgi:hypothetical protein
VSGVKERAKELIDRLPDEVVTDLLEESLDFEKAIAEFDPTKGVELREFLRTLKEEGHPSRG